MIGWKAVGVFGLCAVVALALMAARVKILTLERDQAVAARVMAEGELKLMRHMSILITDALDTAREDDNDRSKFTIEAHKQIERGRKVGDEPLDPVSVDVLVRVRDRYRTFQDSRNP